jgi:hypothetical protein
LRYAYDRHARIGHPLEEGKRELASRTTDLEERDQYRTVRKESSETLLASLEVRSNDIRSRGA